VIGWRSSGTSRRPNGRDWSKMSGRVSKPKRPMGQLSYTSASQALHRNQSLTDANKQLHSPPHTSLAITIARPRLSPPGRTHFGPSLPSHPPNRDYHPPVLPRQPIPTRQGCHGNAQEAEGRALPAGGRGEEDGGLLAGGGSVGEGSLGGCAG